MNKITKIVIAALLAIVLLTGGTLAVLKVGFGIDVFDQSGWEQAEDGSRYYLDYHGDPMLDWQQIDGQWYYLDPGQGGALRTGWLDLNGSRYYLSAEGIRATGWITLADGTYYFSPTTGAMSTGWLQLPEGTYYLAEDGKQVKGWLSLGEAQYYLSEAGTVTTGWLELDGNRYFLDNTGAMVTGWIDTADGRCYLNEESGILHTGWLETQDGRCYLDENGYLATGWIDLDEGRFCLDENGYPCTGWLEAEEGLYYLDETGKMTIGWLTLENASYYFHENGLMATGQVTIDEVNHFFTSTGEYVVLVNKWNPVPEGYTPELVTYRGWEVDASCYDALVQMLTDLDATGYYYKITSAYRSERTQQSIWDTRYYRYVNSGYSHQGALDRVALEVAVPGTSEHHLGLAIDISGDASQVWLEEHCWEYGFIVRYPDGKTDITGIIYEPWHYRYVGVDLAMELRDSGLCLEEYMALHSNAPTDETIPEESTGETTPEDAGESTEAPVEESTEVTEEPTEEVTQAPAA